MSRVDTEHTYWDKAALDPEVDAKYICDMPTEDCLQEASLAFPGEIDGKKVAELGCGVGRLIIPMSQIFPDTSFTGIDISDKMLSIAKARSAKVVANTSVKPKPISFIQNNGRNVPGGPYDVVYSMLVFQHIDPEGVVLYLRAIKKALTRHGILHFQYIEGDEHEPFSHHYKLPELIDMLADAGFTRVMHIESRIHPQWSWITASL